MRLRQLLPRVLIFAGLVAAVTAARAAGSVQLELVGDPEGAGMLFQEWGQTLSKAGITNVRLRSGTERDKVGIETRGSGDSPSYLVTGIVASGDELILPNGRYHRGDMGRLAQWLKDLAEHGPSTGKEEKAAFGLSRAQFQKVRADLTARVSSPTQGIARRQVLANIAGQLKLPLKLDSQAAAALGDDKVEEDLTELTCGTALACVLRPAGYCMVPRATGAELAYVVVKAEPKLENWPVGWAPDKSAKDSLPALFDFLNVNIQNVSAATALDAIAKRVKAQVLFDHHALAQYGIDPDKTMVTLPRGRTTYSLTLRKLLFQARLQFEVRTDEAGTPFLWVTSIKPV